MTSFRKLASVYSALFVSLMVFAATASAQPSFSCTILQGTSTMARGEGMAELVGDYVIICTGGTPTAAGVAMPQVSIQAYLNANVTSQILSTVDGTSLTEALLTIDEPSVANQIVCNNLPASTCSDTGTGAGGGSGGSFTSQTNVFPGILANANSLLFEGIPVDPPGPTGVMTLRITNVRVNANQLGVSLSTLIPAQVLMWVAVTPSGNLPISNNPQLQVATVQVGLNTLSVSQTNTGVDAAHANYTNTTPLNLAQATGVNQALATNPAATGGATNLEIKLTEGFNTAFRIRGGSSPTDTTFVHATPNVPMTYPWPPGGPYESGFYNPGFAGTNLAGAGLASQGTRLMVKFSGIPAGIMIYAGLEQVPYNAANPLIGSTQHVAAGLVSGVDANGAGPYIATVPTTIVLTSTGSSIIAAPLTVSGGNATATYEILAADPVNIDRLVVGFALAYVPDQAGNLPNAGAATVGVTFAPTSTVTTATSTDPVPRFFDDSPANSKTAFNIVSSWAPPLAPVLTAPIDGAVAVLMSQPLMWTYDLSSLENDIYFGTSASPPFLTSSGQGSYNTQMSAGTTYYWYVVSKNSYGSSQSPTWSFTTVQPTAVAVTNGQTNFSAGAQAVALSATLTSQAGVVNNGSVAFTINTNQSVTAASAAKPAVLTSANHGLTNGAVAVISGATGDWAGLNGTWTVTVSGLADPVNTFSVPFDGTVPTDALQGTVVFAQQVAVPVSNGVASVVTYPMPAGQLPGAYTITAAYSGSVTLPSGQGTGAEVIQEPTATTVAPATAWQSATAQSVPLTATVAGASGAPVVNVGTVQFTVSDPNNGNTVVGSPVTSPTVSGGSAAANYAIPGGLPIGALPYNVTAVYSGDGLTPSVVLTSTGNSTLTLQPQTNITVNTVPVGLQFTVDGGAPLTAPRTIPLSQGAHTIAVVSPQTTGVAGYQYTFQSWSDGGAQSHSITVGATSATYTATFSTQYQLLISAYPAAGGSVTPVSGGFYNAGSQVALGAVANPGYSFTGWTAGSDLNGNTLTMNGPEAVVGNFSPLAPAVTVAPGTANFSITAQTVALSATVTSMAGTVTDGTVSFTINTNRAITAASAANPTVLTSANHGLSDGDVVVISGATGDWAGLNGAWTVTVSTMADPVNTFSVPFDGTAPADALQGTVVFAQSVSAAVSNGAASVPAYPIPAGQLPGAYTITAVYAGSLVFPNSQGTGAEVIQEPTTTTVTPAVAPQKANDQSVTLTATVAGITGAPVVSVGTVQFTVTDPNNGNAVIGSTVTSPTVSGGSASASFTIPGGTPAGALPYTVTAVYSGDGVTPTPAVLTSTGSSTLTLAPQGSIIIATNPTGLQFTVDGGAALTAPQTLTLPQGVHSIAVASPQTAPGIQYVYQSWSDGGAQAHSITVGTTAATYTAAFQTQYQLALSASPAAGGNVFPPFATYYNAGTVVPVAASQNPGYVFSTWFGPVAAASSSTTSVTMNAPVTATAVFVIPSPSVSPSSLPLQYQMGATPAAMAQAITLSAATAVSYRVTSSAAWLVPAAYSGSAPSSLSVTVNPAGLAAGTYNGALSFTFGDSSMATVQVSLTVTAQPQLVLTPASVAFTAQAGSTSVQTAGVTLTSQYANTAFTISSTVSSPAGGSWLGVTRVGTSTPATLSIQANPAGLAAGTYQGSVVVTAAGASNSPFTIPVTLVVSPSPVAPITISGISNGASFQSGGGVGPNTVLSLFGANLSCSSQPEVLVGGVSAEVLGYTATQINFVVPPEGAGAVQVICNGVQSAAYQLFSAVVSPAIFTQSMSGTGQGSILNQDMSVNSAALPAARGTYIAIYGTGFGALNAAGADGLEWLTLPVTAYVGGIPATVQYAGAAPGYTVGLQQINVLVPANAPTGAAVSVLLMVNGVETQNGVTVALQ
jgi:uncharacterized protein (TIGR03437 family)